MKRIADNFAFRTSAPLHKVKRGLRLRHMIWACALFGVMITELLVLGSSYAFWRYDQINKIDSEALLMLKANVDTTSFPSVDDILKMGDRITGFSDVRGGAVYNRMGEQVATFGSMPPSLSMRTFQREGIRYLYSLDGTYLDIYYSIDATGLANPIVLRLDVRNIPVLLQERLREKAMATFSVAFISALAIVLLMNITIVRPIQELRSAILRATDNPNMASTMLLRWDRGDEFGDVSKALDMLFTTVSVVYQEDLSALHEMRQQSAFPILTYDASWRLINANAAALALFGCENYGEIAAQHEQFIRQSDKDGQADMSPKELINNSNMVKVVNVLTPHGLKRCIMNAVIVHKRGSAIFRIVVELTDVSKLALQIETMKAETALMTSGNQDLKRRLTEMRSLFQSCHILLSHANRYAAIAEEAAADSTHEPPNFADAEEMENVTRPIALTDRIVNAWLFNARANHLIDSKLTHNVLPPAYGKPEEVEAVFGQALMAVYSQANHEKPMLHIKAETIEKHKTLFEIWLEKPRANSRPRQLDDILIAGAQLSLASLQQSLKSIGGVFHEAGGGKVSFVLETALFTDDALRDKSVTDLEPGAEDELNKILDMTGRSA